MFAVILCIEID